MLHVLVETNTAAILLVKVLHDEQAAGSVEIRASAPSSSLYAAAAPSWLSGTSRLRRPLGSSPPTTRTFAAEIPVALFRGSVLTTQLWKTPSSGFAVIAFE